MPRLFYLPLVEPGVFFSLKAITKGPAACDANSRTPKKPNPLEQTLNQADENHDIVRGNTGYQTADGMG